MSLEFDQARARKPLPALAAEHGRRLDTCPICSSAAMVERSGRFTDGFVERVNQATNIVDLVGKSLTLKKSGASFVACCPFHNEKSPSFNVVPGKNIFHCFGCQMGGNPVKWMMETAKLSFPEAVLQLAKDAGIEPEYENGARHYLKCSRGGCAANQRGLDEVGWLEAVCGLDRASASTAYLQQAGVTRGQRLGPSVMPGARPRRHMPVAPEVPGDEGKRQKEKGKSGAEEPAPARSGERGARSEDQRSGSEDFGPGTRDSGPAGQEQEQEQEQEHEFLKRASPGVIPAAGQSHGSAEFTAGAVPPGWVITPVATGERTAEPGEAGDGGATSSSSAGFRSNDAAASSATPDSSSGADQGVSISPAASAAGTPRRIGATVGGDGTSAPVAAPQRGADEVKRQKEKGKSTGEETSDLGPGTRDAGPAGQQKAAGVAAKEVGRGTSTEEACETDSEGNAGTEAEGKQDASGAGDADEGKSEKEKGKSGGGEQEQEQEQEQEHEQVGKGTGEAKTSDLGPGTRDSAAGPTIGRGTLCDDPVAGLREFYGETVWEAADQLALFQKRALVPSTSRVLGFRSNRPENEPVIRALAGKYEASALASAGLLERNFDETRPVAGYPAGYRPASGFTGFGEVAKVKLKGQNLDRMKDELRDRFKEFAPLTFKVDEEGKELRVIGLNRAPIIPYFQTLPEEPESIYDLMVICEGEFKGGAVWQAFAAEPSTLPEPNVARLIALRTHKLWAWGAQPHCWQTPSGHGTIRMEGKDCRVGVVALPGIHFGRLEGGTWQVADELRECLRLTRTRTASVFYDNEEKGDERLPGFQERVDRRFDSVAQGLFLARDLWKVNVAGQFGMIPNEFRNPQTGKVDWDQALADLVFGRSQPAGALGPARSAERGARSAAGESGGAQAHGDALRHGVRRAEKAKTERRRPVEEEDEISVGSLFAEG